MAALAVRAMISAPRSGEPLPQLAPEQEVLHRYRSINRWHDGRRVYDLARQIFANIIPIDIDTLDRARELMDTLPSLMARDALHAAVVQQYGLEAICSFDTDFDHVPALTRIEP